MSFIPPVPDQVSSGNSTTAILGGGATFTGAAIDLTASPITKITVEAFSDQPSAVGGFQIQYSPDNSHWDHKISTSLSANASASVVGGAYARYVRVVYTNGVTIQGLFRLQTLISVLPALPTIKDLDTLVTSDDSAEVVRAILTGKTIIGSKYTDVQTDIYGSLQVVTAGQASDAFGRARVTNPVTLFASQFQYDAQALLFNTSVVGAGTVAKTANESSLTLSTGGTTSGDGAINQSKQYLRYEPGKSQSILMTGVLGAQKTNVRSRIGYFDVNDGVFFEMNGSDGAAVVVRTSTSGSPSDAARTLQVNWNADPMDGTGPSGVTIDFTKAQIFAIDMQWLGAGRVRFGFFVDGVLVVCHQVFNANVLAVPYMNTANLPARAEIFNTGTSASTTTMKQICVSVLSEGGQEDPSTYQFSAGNVTTAVTAASATRTALFSIRPKATFNSITNRSKIALLGASIFVNDTHPVFWELVYNGTLGGTPVWNSVDSNSGVEKDVAGTGPTGGKVITSGYVAAANGVREAIAQAISVNFPFTLDYAGTGHDVFTLCASGIGGTAATLGVLIWEETR